MENKTTLLDYTAGLIPIGIVVTSYSKKSLMIGLALTKI
jgi:hypothetical protein